MLSKLFKKYGTRRYYLQPTAIAPLATFRVAFGFIMLLSIIRFLWLDWVADQYLNPEVHFHYYGFDWVQVPGPSVLYGLFVLMGLAAMGIMLGAFYRLSAVLFFLTFSYVELLDLTYYLNHYYFVSIVAFLMIWLPANRYAAVDVWRNPGLKVQHVPLWIVGVVRAQLAIVYVYAGLAKINYDWLFNALPLKIWLPAHNDLWLIGPLFQYEWVAYAFSWAGMLYDLTIPAWLLWRPTRPFAFVAVVGFHAMTGILFQIGMFPVIMIGASLVFFPSAWHQKSWQALLGTRIIGAPLWQPQAWRAKAMGIGLGVFFIFQLLFPWRYLLYPGNLFWTEEGYRFSWRVMLVEKAGTATFYVKDRKTGREGVVVNSEFLNRHQEKQMSFQPDMILQFAHFLHQHYEQQGMHDPIVRAEVYVTMNARPSQLLINPEVDLSRVTDGWAAKDWILPHRSAVLP